jgi:hypothetical protein
VKPNVSDRNVYHELYLRMLLTATQIKTQILVDILAINVRNPFWGLNSDSFDPSRLKGIKQSDVCILAIVGSSPSHLDGLGSMVLISFMRSDFVGSFDTTFIHSGSAVASAWGSTLPVTL